jgi:glycerol-3-phosphate dehydrogenase
MFAALAMSVSPQVFDLLIVGGGINGAGIARDAAGRGLRVLLVEKDDLAGATSSASTKLIHGGLRYLEHYEFRLVREALAEREVLLRLAPHIIWPLRFVMPHEPHLRPAPLIRLGLFLYDYIGGRRSLPASGSVDFATDIAGAALKPQFRRGFDYADCWVDDARLVVLNAVGARDKGATVLTRTALTSARRDGELWRADLSDGQQVAARMIVNAAGPWVRDLLTARLGQSPRNAVRLIKGSHIVVRRRFEGSHAYIFQNDDRRVIFAIPYEDDFTLIGTTDIAVEDGAAPTATAAEIDYLCAAASRYFRDAVQPADVVWTYSGVRPLYDDGESDPSSITRDYVLDLDAPAGQPPLLSIYGGKITTFRRLAEHALDKIEPFFPAASGRWTKQAPLPGGALGERTFDTFVGDLARGWPQLDPLWLRRLARRHGARATAVLGDTRQSADLGQDFGAGLHAREVDYLRREEWARTADDVLWRRTKCGLHMNAAQRRAVAEWMDRA